MSVIKRIVCFANSRKLQGRCIAGKEFKDGVPGPWLRPVSSREHEEVSEYERQYEDGTDPRILDIIDVPLISPKPKSYQSENWLLDPELYWNKVDTLEWNELHTFVDPIASLWINGYHTNSGNNDQIPLTLAQSLDSSLRLIYVDQVNISVFRPGEIFGNKKRRVQASFRHGNVQYSLWITDPIYERAFLAKLDGDYVIGESYMTISLGEPYKDNCYKLVAAIIERP